MQKTNNMTWEQLLLRKRPELMRRWHEDKTGTYAIHTPTADLAQPAIITVELQFSDGLVENVRLPIR